MPTISAIFREVNVLSPINVTLYAAMIMSLVGCQPITLSPGAAAPIASPPHVQVTLLPPMTIGPTPACMPVLGVDLDAVPLSFNSIRVKIAGLKPNEHVAFVFYSEADGRTFKIESNPLEGADDNGNIEYTQGGLDQTFKEWQVQVIHSRGVACAAISLP